MKISFLLDNSALMEADSIYLDGVIRGTVLDLEKNSFSFDHHGDGTRFDKSSATFQVACAIAQGLDMSTIKSVYVNHTDADSVLAGLLCLKPELLTSRLMGLIQDLSRIDNHGPAACLVDEPSYGYHFQLRPAYGVKDSEEVYLEKLALAEELIVSGKIYEPAPERKFPGRAVGFNPKGEVVIDTGWIEAGVNFNDVYSVTGMGVIFGSKGMVTIGKKPFFKAPSFKALIDTLNKLESGWGGADSIMGSPRPNGSSLSPETVIGIVSEFIIS